MPEIAPLFEPLVALIMSQSSHFDPKDLREKVKELRKQIDTKADEYHKQRLANLSERAPAPLAAAIKIALEKGASSWVTATPSYEHATILHKGEFVGAIYIRYGWDTELAFEMCLWNGV